MRHLDELLSAYLDGETTRAESIRVARHLGECLRCRRDLAGLSEARSAVRSLPTLELPSTLLGPDREPIPLHRRRSLWVGTAAAVAALVVTIATLVTPPRPPLDLAEVSRQVGARASLDLGSTPMKLVVLESAGAE